MSEKHLVVVTDGTNEIQRWLDAVVDAALRNAPAGDWPHPHPTIPPGAVTVGELVRAVETCFSTGKAPWSVVTRGFPPPPGSRAPTDGTDTDPPRPRGSDFHNLMHNLLGNFH